MADAATEEVEQAEEAFLQPAIPAEQFVFNLLHVIRTAQSQNGIKHGDFKRYRHHCANKLAFLRKNLKFQHGRAKFVKRKIEPARVSDIRFIYIPLFNAERAWAYAMELKKEAEDKKGDPRKRKHLIKRLAKAHYWSAEVVRLAEARCDAKSFLEAEAYASWMHGNYLLEKEIDWDLALAKFMRAKKLFDELSKVVPLDLQTLCIQQVEEMEPSIRFCTYQISRKGMPTPSSSQLQVMGDRDSPQAMDVLQAKLAELAQEAQSQQAASASFVEWQGRKYLVRFSRVKMSLTQAHELEEQLSSTMDTDDGAAEAKVALYDRIINAYSEARSQIRNALKALSAHEADSQYEELQGLETAVLGTILQRTIDRSLLMVSAAEGRFAGALERAALGKKSKDKDKQSRAEDIVRLLELLVRHYTDLSDLAAKLGGRQGEALLDTCAAKIAQAQARRVFYAAHAYLTSGKHLEAFAVFGLAEEKAAAAIERFQQLSASGAAAVLELKQLAKQAVAYKAIAQAERATESLKTQEMVQQGVGSISLTDQQQQQQQASTAASGYLLDHLDVWESFTGQPGGKTPRLYKAPFAFQAIPVRPIMLDTASNFVAYPSLEHRVKKAAPKSMLSSFFGWGSRK